MSPGIELGTSRTEGHALTNCADHPCSLGCTVNFCVVVCHWAWTLEPWARLLKYTKACWIVILLLCMCSRLNSRNPNAIETNNWGCINVDQTTSVHDSWYRQSISHKRYPIIGWNSLTYLYIIPQDEPNCLNTFPQTVAHTLYVYDLIKCMHGSSFFPSLCSQPCPPPFEFLISWFFVILRLHTFRRLFVIYWHVPLACK